MSQEENLFKVPKTPPNALRQLHEVVQHMPGKTVVGAAYEPSHNLLRVELDDGSTVAMIALGMGMLKAQLFLPDEKQGIINDLQRRVEELERKLAEKKEDEEPQP